MDDTCEPDVATFLPLSTLRRRRSVKWRTYDADVLPLWVAEMDTAPAPAIADALHTAVAEGDTGYVHAGDVAEVYAAFSQQRYGWAPDSRRTSLIPDVMHGIAAVLRLTTRPGTAVVIDPPIYPPFWHFVRHSDRTVVEAGLRRVDGAYRVDLDALEQAFSRGAAAYLLCNPQNPTGTVWRRDELLGLADLADRHQVLVLADEVHAPLTHPGAAHVPFASLDHPAVARSVTFVAASKGWNLPGLKAGLAVAGDDMPDAVAQLPHEIEVGTGLLGVIAARAAFAHGVGWLASLLDQLDHNRRLLAELLAAHLPGVRYRPPDGTYLAWLDCRALGLGDDPAAAFLARGRVALNAGATFGAAGKGHVRLNMATSPEILTAAVRRMATALDV